MCFLANTLDRRAHFAFLLVNRSWRAHFFLESASVPAGTSLTGLHPLTSQWVTCLSTCSVFIASFADVSYRQIYTYNSMDEGREHAEMTTKNPYWNTPFLKFMLNLLSRNIIFIRLISWIKFYFCFCKAAAFASGNNY